MRNWFRTILAMKFSSCPQSRRLFSLSSSYSKIMPYTIWDKSFRSSVRGLCATRQTTASTVRDLANSSTMSRTLIIKELCSLYPRFYFWSCKPQKNKNENNCNHSEYHNYLYFTAIYGFFTFLWNFEQGGSSSWTHFLEPPAVIYSDKAVQ